MAFLGPELYLHYEDAAPEFTLKFVLGGAPTTVGQALADFAKAYASTGKALQVGHLSLAGSSGVALDGNAILPCGLAPGSDVFVSSADAPGDATPAAIAAAPAAILAAARPKASGSSATAPASGAHVYAKQGSAIAASQAKMGENSYYYSVGKNRAALPKPPAPTIQAPKAVETVAARLPEATISSYSMIDDDAKVKVNIPMAGASNLAEGAIRCAFRDRSFDLTVTTDGKLLRLHIPILLEEINQQQCSCRKRQGKLLVILEKRDASKQWYELRKTKGIGDLEYAKIVPDSGEAVEFTL